MRYFWIKKNNAYKYVYVGLLRSFYAIFIICINILHTIKLCLKIFNKDLISKNMLGFYTFLKMALIHCFLIFDVIIYRNRSDQIWI